MIDVSRRELKYLMQTAQAARLGRRASEVMQSDPNNGAEGYKVRSLYFDSLYDSDFEEKVSGSDRRKKIRLRIYDMSSEVIKLELKEKEGNAQRKRSLSLSREEAQKMIQGEYTFLISRREPVARWLYTYMTMHCCRPKCIVEYRRRAFLEPINDIRITFDSELKATEAGMGFFDRELMLYPVAPPGEVTMEVKYNRFLYTHIKELLNQSDKIQISNSKYVRARMISKRGRK